MKNPFHKHKWNVTIYAYPHDMHEVRECLTCSVFQSKVRDRRTGQERWIEGDIWSRNEPIYVLCENRIDFEYVVKRFRTAGATQPIHYIEDMERLLGARGCTFFVYGKWWERTEIIEDPQFAIFVNGSL